MFISPESGTSIGPFRYELQPYQKEILDTLMNDTHQRVVLLQAARTGKSTCLLAATAYYIAQDPSNIMWVLPSQSEAEKFSRSAIDPLIRDVDCVRELVKTKRGLDSGNTKLEKLHGGNILYLVGAQSVLSLHGKSVKTLFIDEADGMEMTKDGHPVSLSEHRTTTFPYSRKIVIAGTPKIKGLSILEKEYLESDQRVYEIPCPSCKHFQPLEWRDETGTFRLSYIDDPANPVYICRSCSYAIEESQKLNCLRAGRWVARNPSSTTAGFYVNALYSMFRTWQDVCDEWRRTEHDTEALRTFINSTLAQTFDNSRTTISTDELVERLERYPCDVPDGVGILTYAIDVQDNRLEYAVFGWGLEREHWLIDHVIFYGDPERNDVWNDLHKFIRSRKYKNINNADVDLTVGCIDIGGHFTEKVYLFVEAFRKTAPKNHFLLPVQGQDRYEAHISISPKHSDKYNAGYHPIGTNHIKHYLTGILKNKDKGPEYLHLPLQFPQMVQGEYRDITEEHLLQFTSEREQVVEKRGGDKVTKWRKVRRRNEMFDLWRMAWCGYKWLGPALIKQMPDLVKELSERKPAAGETNSLPSNQQAPQQSPPKPNPYRVIQPRRNMMTRR